MSDFPGFRKPTDNYHKLPNEITDIYARIDNLPELKVVIYVIRHTWGYQEYDHLKCITTDEFVHGRKKRDGSRMDEGTGLSATGVKEGLARAIKHGYIVCEVDDRDRGRIKKYYGVKLLAMDELDSRTTTIGSRDTTMDSRDEATDSSEATSSSSQDAHRTEKETYVNNFKKETEEKGTHPFFENDDEITNAAIEVCQSLNAKGYVHWLNDELHAVYAASQTHLPLFLKEVDAIAYTIQYLPPDTPENDLQHFVDRLHNRYEIEHSEQPAEQQA